MRAVGGATADSMTAVGGATADSMRAVGGATADSMTAAGGATAAVQTPMHHQLGGAALVTSFFSADSVFVTKI